MGRTSQSTSLCLMYQLQPPVSSSQLLLPPQEFPQVTQWEQSLYPTRPSHSLELLLQLDPPLPHQWLQPTPPLLPHLLHLVSISHPHTQGQVLMVLHHTRVSSHPEGLLMVTEAHLVVPWAVLRVDLRDRIVVRRMLELLVMVDHQEVHTVVPQDLMASMDSPLMLLGLLDIQDLVDHHNMEDPHTVVHLMLDHHLSFLQEDQLVQVHQVEGQELNHQTINSLVVCTCTVT